MWAKQHKYIVQEMTHRNKLGKANTWVEFKVMICSIAHIAIYNDYWLNSADRFVILI